MKTKTISAVFEALISKPYIELSEVAKTVGISRITATRIRNFLVSNGYLQVVGFGSGHSIAYRPRSTYFSAFGRVASVDDIGSDVSNVIIFGHTYDFEGEEIPVCYTLRLSSNILKEIADYKNSDKEVPFF